MAITVYNPVLKKTLGVLVFLTLSLLALRIIIQGPVTSVLRKETIFRDESITLEEFGQPIQHPDITICRVPVYKYDGYVYDILSAQDEDTYNKALHAAFFTRPNETLTAYAVEPTFLEASNSPIVDNLDKVASTFQADLLWNAFCTTVSLERFKQQKASQGMNGTDGDMSYYALMWLKGDQSKDLTYLIKVHQPGEAIVNGAFTMMPLQEIQLLVKQARLYDIQYKYEKKINNCNPKNELITTCIADYFKQKYGTGWEASRKTAEELSDLKIRSPEVIASLTGCLVPCETFKYTLSPLAHFRLKYVPLKDLMSPFNGSDDGALLTLKHDKMTKINVNEEVIRYTGNSFIAEVGGVIGIFLGLSFWSLYDVISVTFVSGKSS